jgi:hypothetical protein
MDDHMESVSNAAAAEAEAEQAEEVVIPGDGRAKRLESRLAAYSAAQDEWMAHTDKEIKALWLECLGLAACSLISAYICYKMVKEIEIIRLAVRELKNNVALDN